MNKEENFGSAVNYFRSNSEGHTGGTVGEHSDGEKFVEVVSPNRWIFRIWGRGYILFIVE